MRGITGQQYPAAPIVPCQTGVVGDASRSFERGDSDVSAADPPDRVREFGSTDRTAPVGCRTVELDDDDLARRRVHEHQTGSGPVNTGLYQIGWFERGVRHQHVHGGIGAVESEPGAHDARTAVAADQPSCLLRRAVREADVDMVPTIGDVGDFVAVARYRAAVVSVLGEDLDQPILPNLQLSWHIGEDVVPVDQREHREVPFQTRCAPAFDELGDFRWRLLARCAGEIRDAGAVLGCRAGSHPVEQPAPAEQLQCSGLQPAITTVLGPARTPRFPFVDDNRYPAAS